MPIPLTLTFHFANDNRAQSIEVTPRQRATTILKAFSLPRPRALLILNGGTAQLPAALTTQLAQLLQDGLARTVAESGITVLTGGTQAGIFALFGQGLARWGRTAPCIGVTVADLVSFPGKEQGEAPLEPNHSHFVLVKGKEWGDETNTMYRLASELDKSCPSLAVFVGGGEITIHEMQKNVAQKRTMILLAGSGRATDGVLAARNGKPVEDRRLVEIAQLGNIVPFAFSRQARELSNLIRQFLTD